MKLVERCTNIMIFQDYVIVESEICSIVICTVNVESLKVSAFQLEENRKQKQ